MKNLQRKFLSILFLFAVTTATQIFSMKRTLRQAQGRQEGQEPNENEPPRKKRKLEKNYDNCSICLQKLTDNIKILACIHKFHRPCINQWLMQKEESPDCPECRKKVENSSLLPTQEEIAEIEQTDPEFMERQRERATENSLIEENLITDINPNEAEQILEEIRAFDNPPRNFIEDTNAPTEEELILEGIFADDDYDDIPSGYTVIENQIVERTFFENCYFKNCTIRCCKLVSCIVDYATCNYNEESCIEVL